MKQLDAYCEHVDGTPFGRYRLVELLGRGGMGEVWRAHDTDTDRIVAIKLLPAHFSENADFQRRFRREAHAAARLNNPHVIPIHYYGEIDGRLFVDMRLIEGRDLQAILADGPLEPARAVRIIEQIAEALHAAHKIGLVHRDVKPSNVLLDESDFAYLIDFGIARAAGETGLTGTSGVIGSWHYMAPERFGAKDVDQRSDVYSLACVLWECLTGQRPYPGDSLEQQYAGHVAAPPPRPSSAGAPAEFDTVIATGMAKDPDNRYATTVELANAAHDAITTPIPRPAKPPAPQPPTVQVPAPPAEPATPHERYPRVPTRAAPRWSPDAAPPGAVSPTAPTRHRPPAAPAPARQPADLHRPARQPDSSYDLPPPGRGSARRPGWRRKNVVIPIAVVLAVVAVAALVIVVAVIPDRGPAGSTPTARPSSTTPASTATTTRGPAYGPQTELPFTGLNRPGGVAVDAPGGVYVSDNGNNRVLRLAAGSNTQSDVAFTGIERPVGVAVSAAGDVYVADASRVLKLAAGSNSQTTLPLPFNFVEFPDGVAVNTGGDVYATNEMKLQVLKLAAGSNTETVLPVTSPVGASLNGSSMPRAIAVNDAGDVYVTTMDRVLKLAAGSGPQTELPFTGLNSPNGVAVDGAGNVYVTDGNRVLKLAAGSGPLTELPFTGLNSPNGVAVDGAGNVYVTDGNRVVKLAAG